jgi:hypothetical protein
MDDSEWGTEDRRGYWKPKKPLTGTILNFVP